MRKADDCPAAGGNSGGRRRGVGRGARAVPALDQGVLLGGAPATTARVLGGWTFLLALLAGWIVVHGRVGGSRLAALAMAAFPVGALVAGLRTAEELRPASDRAVYFLGLLACFAVGLALVREGGRAAAR